MVEKEEIKTVYGGMGIDAHKGVVENAFGGKVDNAFPGAWVNITHDRKLPGYVKTFKGDGDGSKPTQNCLEYLETGNEAVLETSADDSHAMPVIDAAASGFVDEYDFIDIIEINKLISLGFKSDVLNNYARRIREIIDLHISYGIIEDFHGGETADLPSQTPSYITNGVLHARTHIDNVVRGNVQPGDSIWGVSSGGQTIWEKVLNSGIACNGITITSSILMWEGYNKKYPWLSHEKNKYWGRFKVDDCPKELGGLTVSEAIRSGTRQWAIFLKLFYDELKRLGKFHLLHAVSVNTGGGTAKVTRLGKNIRYAKKMPEFLPIFKLILEEGKGKVSPAEMFEDFNCGVGIDIIGFDEDGILGATITKVCRENNLSFYELGHCEPCNVLKNEVFIESEYGEFLSDKDGHFVKL